MDIKIKKENLMEAYKTGCPDTKAILRKLFPEQFPVNILESMNIPGGLISKETAKKIGPGFMQLRESGDLKGKSFLLGPITDIKYKVVVDNGGFQCLVMESI